MQPLCNLHAQSCATRSHYAQSVATMHTCCPILRDMQVLTAFRPSARHAATMQPSCTIVAFHDRPYSRWHHPSSSPLASGHGHVGRPTILFPAQTQSVRWDIDHPRIASLTVTEETGAPHHCDVNTHSPTTTAIPAPSLTASITLRLHPTLINFVSGHSREGMPGLDCRLVNIAYTTTSISRSIGIPANETPLIHSPSRHSLQTLDRAHSVSPLSPECTKLR